MDRWYCINYKEMCKIMEMIYRIDNLFNVYNFCKFYIC